MDVHMGNTTSKNQVVGLQLYHLMGSLETGPLVSLSSDTLHAHRTSGPNTLIWILISHIWV